MSFSGCCVTHNTDHNSIDGEILELVDVSFSGLVSKSWLRILTRIYPASTGVPFTAVSPNESSPNNVERQQQCSSTIYPSRAYPTHDSDARRNGMVNGTNEGIPKTNCYTAKILSIPMKTDFSSYRHAFVFHSTPKISSIRENSALKLSRIVSFSFLVTILEKSA